MRLPARIAVVQLDLARRLVLRARMHVSARIVRIIALLRLRRGAIGRSAVGSRRRADGEDAIPGVGAGALSADATLEPLAAKVYA